MLACRSGHIEIVQALVNSKHADIQIPDEVHLHLTVYQFHTNNTCKCAQYCSNVQHCCTVVSIAYLIKFLLQDGWTPLMIACRGGHEKLVQELLKANADVNAVSKVRNCLQLHMYVYEVSFITNTALKYKKWNCTHSLA